MSHFQSKNRGNFAKTRACETTGETHVTTCSLNETKTGRKLATFTMASFLSVRSLGPYHSWQRVYRNCKVCDWWRGRRAAFSLWKQTVLFCALSHERFDRRRAQERRTASRLLRVPSSSHADARPADTLPVTNAITPKRDSHVFPVFLCGLVIIWMEDANTIPQSLCFFCAVVFLFSA